MSTPYQRIKLEVARRRTTNGARPVKKGRRGVALILVLGALVVLTVFVTELQERTSSTLSASLAERDTLRAEYNAKSAINLSRLLIATEPVVRKAIDPLYRVAMKSPAPQIPVWKFTSLVLGPFNDSDGAQDFARVTQTGSTEGKNLGLFGGHFEIKIIDEDSKINLNSVVNGDPVSRERLGAQLLGLFGGAHYNDLFEGPDLDGQNSNQPVICGALVDWADYDEAGYPCDPAAAARSRSAPSEQPEDNYYQSVGLPYQRKNAAFDSLDEIRLVRGVGDGFWSNFVDPDPNDPDQRVLTVWGQGAKINVNTANAQTLLALVCSGAPEAPLCVDPEQMSIFLTAVTLARQISGGAPLFKSAKAFTRAMRGKGKGVGPVFTALGLQPVEFSDVKRVEKAISVESRVFSIYVDGVIPGRNRETRVRIHDVVDFRSANELGGDPAATSKSGSTTSEDEEAADSTTQELTPEQLAAAMASDPMGVIVYHRIE
ncbi:MAG: type II secretion system protein GspK [Polyangiaceae bacterium]